VNASAPIEVNMACCDAQLFPCVDAATLAAQPFPVQQVGTASSARMRVRPSRSIASRLCAIGGLARAQERARASLDAQRPIGATGAGHARQRSEGVRGALGVSAARGRLDELA